jgi:hypothetical protein
LEFNLQFSSFVELSSAEWWVLVQDEFEAASPAEVWWFLHTQAEVEVDGHTATLSLATRFSTAS